MYTYNFVLNFFLFLKSCFVHWYGVQHVLFTNLYINYSFYRDIHIEQGTNTTFWAKCCLCHQDTKEKLHSTGEGQDANHIKQARYCLQVSLCAIYVKLKEACSKSGSNASLFSGLMIIKRTVKCAFTGI